MLALLRRTLARFVAAFAAVGALAHAQDTLVGITWDGSLVEIEATSGAQTLVGSSGLNGCSDVAIALDGRILTETAGPPSVPKFWRLDPEFATSSFYRFAMLQELHAFSYAPDGKLWAISHNQPFPMATLLWYSFPPGPDAVPNIVNQVKLGPFSIPVAGLAFSPAGTLYGWSPGTGLITIDTGTA